MEFNYKKLCEKIVEKFSCNCNFAIKMGISERTLSLKINNKIDFKQREILKASKLLGIPKNEIQDYFFTLKVQKIEQ